MTKRPDTTRPLPVLTIEREGKTIHLEQIRERLRELLRQKGVDLTPLRERTPPHDDGEIAGALHDKALTGRVCDIENVSRNQILVAISRIEDGSYGKCLHCDSEIKLIRIVAQPESPFCNKCQTTLDKGMVSSKFRAEYRDLIIPSNARTRSIRPMNAW